MIVYCVYWISTKGHTDYNSQGYVGITNNINKRFKEHQKKTGSHLQRAITKYGWSNLNKTILVSNVDKELAMLVESMLRPNMQIGWNIASGGGGGCTVGELSKEQKEKISKSNKGKVRTIQQKQTYSLSKLADNNPMYKKYGSECCNFKYIIEATSVKTGEIILLYGKNHINSCGFDDKKVYTCANGKQKTHRGHTFRKIVYAK